MQGKFALLIVPVLVISSLMPFTNGGNGIQSDSLYSNSGPISAGNPPGWSDDILLSDPTVSWPDIAVDGNNICIVYDRTISEPFSRHIYFRNSSNGGIFWSGEQKISSPGIMYRSPEIAIDGYNLHIVYSDFDEDEIYYINSTDGGVSWGNPIRISELNGADSNNPDIAVNGDNVYVVWEDWRGISPEVYYSNSSDGGITWSVNKNLTANDAHSSTTTSIVVYDSYIHVAWMDSRDSNVREIYYRSSCDSGITWNSEKNITSIDSFHSEAPKIDIWGTNLHLVWWDSRFGHMEVMYKNSTDNGVTWNDPILLSGDDAHRSLQPDIAVWNDELNVIWNDERDNYDYLLASEIYYTNSIDGGISWTSPQRLTYALNESNQPVIATNGEIIHIAWADNRTGDNLEKRVYYKRSPDFPETDPPNHSNEIPPPDSYRDAPGTNISVHVTDPSGVNESTIQLWINGSPVIYTSTPITDGFNVSFISPGFDPGVVTCRIVADDNLSNHLDFTWNFTVLALYEIQLHEGWNLISVPHVQVDTAIDEVLRDIDGKWDYIQWYDASDPFDHWKTNATFKPPQLNDLFVINRSMAFWINITEPDVNLTVRGHLSTYTEIQLYAGWNLVGFPTQNTDTVANSLWGTGADRVEVYNATAPYRIKEVGATYVMKPGEGYWVHVVADSTWIVNW